MSDTKVKKYEIRRKIGWEVKKKCDRDGGIKKERKMREVKKKRV